MEDCEEKSSKVGAGKGTGNGKQGYSETSTGLKARGG